MDIIQTYFPLLSDIEINSLNNDICIKLIETIEQKNISHKNTIFLYTNKINAYEERIEEQNKITGKMKDEIIALKEEINNYKVNYGKIIENDDINNKNNNINSMDDSESNEKEMDFIIENKEKNKILSDDNKKKIKKNISSDNILENINLKDKIQTFFISNVIEYKFLFEELFVPDINSIEYNSDDLNSNNINDSEENIEYYKNKISRLLNVIDNQPNKDIILKIEYYEDMKYRLATILKKYTDKIILLQDVLLSIREYWKIDQHTEYYLENEMRRIEKEGIEEYKDSGIEFIKEENKKEIKNTEEQQTIEQEKISEENNLNYKKLLWLSKLDNLKIKKIFSILHCKYKKIKSDIKSMRNISNNQNIHITKLSYTNESLTYDINNYRTLYNNLYAEYNRIIDYIRSKEHLLSSLNTKISFMQPIVDRVDNMLKERIELEIRFENINNRYNELLKINEQLKDTLAKLVDPQSFIFSLQQENHNLNSKIKEIENINNKNLNMFKNRIRNRIERIKNDIEYNYNGINHILSILHNIKDIIDRRIINTKKEIEYEHNNKIEEYINIIENKDKHINQLLNSNNNDIIQLIVKEKNMIEKDNEILQNRINKYKNIIEVNDTSNNNNNINEYNNTSNNTTNEYNNTINNNMITIDILIFKEIEIFKDINNIEDIISIIKDIIEENRNYKALLENNDIKEILLNVNEYKIMKEQNMEYEILINNKNKDIEELQDKVNKLETEIKKKNLTVETLKTYVIKLKKNKLTVQE